ncbi:MAG: acyl-CoA/acyl-ACP dehydrogenase [Deltaproteobacteria bacterium]|nr:acyl-CoA/acyl-ACP dehydrogenase [Deltaproteobacteria bacterium]MBW2086105.1 acyl-CoA/acyl-ACP dehydrogenase [Deltaproteobacteria bacterium]
MAYRDIDMNLTDEEKALRDTVRKFGAEVIRPAGIELDALHDPADMVASGSVLWDVFKQYRELGLHKRGMPKAFGGMAEDVSPMSQILAGEEMGYADAGLAISFGACGMPFAMAAFSPDPEVQNWAREYCEDTEGKIIGCWAITEPDHGGDWSLGGDNPKCAPSVRAVKKGDEYIVNGQKAAWVSNGTIATHAVFHMALDPSKGMEGTGLALIPLDLPGISRGKPLNKIGQRALNQGEIFFEEVKIQKKYFLIEDPAIMTGMGETILAGANGGMSIAFAGLAKAAYDEAYNYAKERIQGSVPIFEHQNIKLKLFKMFTMVEAARAAARRQALYNAVNMPPSGAHAVAAKCLSTETAFQVASEAIQIFGGNGLSKEYCIEKIFRDARASMIEDGVNETLSLAAVEYL